MSIESIDLNDLHDGTLAQITVSWGEFARVKLKINPNRYYIESGRTVIILGEKLKHLNCPQELPWGPSNLVNRAKMVESPENEKLEIEMQSGDVIQIEADSIKVSFE